MAPPTKTRWLTRDQQVSWRSFVAATQLLFDRLEDDLEGAAGLSLADYEVLARLSDVGEEGLRMSALAGQTLFSRSRLSHAVRRLEQSGLVSRVPCPSDRRGTNAVLTDEGRAALVAAAPGHVASVREHLVDRLSPEQFRQLGAISDVIADAIRRTGDPAASC
ncbi:MAG TPA: MarR family transcriptional regulator [Acidimicrobiales bacterium]|nr:MarR family transcriptional regulator [Acidimicrobiales bacterium]